jgi:hypothetical protein
MPEAHKCASKHGPFAVRSFSLRAWFRLGGARVAKTDGRPQGFELRKAPKGFRAYFGILSGHHFHSQHNKHRGHLQER